MSALDIFEYLRDNIMIEKEYYPSEGWQLEIWLKNPKTGHWHKVASTGY